MNYTLGLLPEHLQSAEQVAKCISTNSRPCVAEITTSTFEEMVLNNNKVIIIDNVYNDMEVAKIEFLC